MIAELVFGILIAVTARWHVVTAAKFTDMPCLCDERCDPGPLRHIRAAELPVARVVRGRRYKCRA